MDSSHKILIITYYWPPSGGVGVQRWMNFALQLKARGWDVRVLTPENPQFEVKDETLLEKVKEIPTIKVPIWEPFNLFHKITGNKDRNNVKQGLALEKSRKSITDKLMVWIRGNVFIPDPRIFWVRPASKKAIKVIEAEEIGTVITTGPPHSMHLIGKRIKKLTGIKWIADFRDPWSKWDVLNQLNTSSLVMKIHKRLEQSVLDRADHSMTVSPRLAKAFGGIEILNNGVTVGKDNETSDPNDVHFTIGHYGMLNEFRNPRQLWQLLDQMCRENPVFASKLRIRLGGIVSESIKNEISGLSQLNNKVEFLGYLPHDTIQNEYQKCNVLLLLLNRSNNSEWILPVKFFEYLHADRMILALGERQSDLGDLMKGKNIGEIISFSDIDGMRGFLEDIYENERQPDPDDKIKLLSHFSHTNLIGKLEALIEDG